MKETSYRPWWRGWRVTAGDHQWWEDSTQTLGQKNLEVDVLTHKWYFYLPFLVLWCSSVLNKCVRLSLFISRDVNLDLQSSHVQINDSTRDGNRHAAQRLHPQSQVPHSRWHLWLTFTLLLAGVFLISRQELPHGHEEVPPPSSWFPAAAFEPGRCSDPLLPEQTGAMQISSPQNDVAVSFINI